MSVRVGIPRALLYYYYFPLWKEFLEQLGTEVIVSAPTTKGILTKGVEQCVDDACLPIKLAFGHVQNLVDKGVDVIFLPRIVSVAQREYICPKFLGFPDMVRQNINNLPMVLDTTVDLRKKQSDVTDFVNQVGANFGKGKIKSRLAFGAALRKQRHYQDLLEQGLLPGEALTILAGKKAKLQNTNTDLTIAVIGHPYNIYDPFISMNLLNRLNKMGAKVLTVDHLTPGKIAQGAAKLPKKLFWTLSKRVTGGALYFQEKSMVDGIIHVSAFACGPDSMTGDLIERFIRREGRMPFLNINLDEHTGEAGIITRVEAFLDMVRWRRAVV